MSISSLLETKTHSKVAKLVKITIVLTLPWVNEALGYVQQAKTASQFISEVIRLFYAFDPWIVQQLTTKTVVRLCIC